MNKINEQQNQINIIKRDGRMKPFDESKIQIAIQKSFIAVDGELTEFAITKSKNISSFIKEKASEKPLSVEEIQDLVENGLMSTKRKDVARAYIIYRNERTREREKKSNLMQSVRKKITATNNEKQNANVDEQSFGGRRGEAVNVVMKQDALDNCMSEMARENHDNMLIYQHDLDSYSLGMHNCLTVPFDPLFENGFNTRQVDIRPPQSVSAACQQVAVLFQLQSLQQFGGVAASHLDWTLAPYVLKTFVKKLKIGFKHIAKFTEEEIDKIIDWFNNLPSNERSITNTTLINEYPDVYAFAYEMTETETYQAVEAMYHNLNSLQSRSGNQLPFSSINYGTCTNPEGRLITKALLDNSIKGVGKLYKTSIFPCGIFQLMDGVNKKPGDPNYDLKRLALKSTSLRLYPNYANVEWSGNAGFDRNDPKTYFATMGCRTANGWDINGFGQLKDGRGNICPVTIILPMLAMMAVEEAEYPATVGCDIYIDPVDKFMQILDKKIFEAKDMLLERFEYICSQPVESAMFMYENNMMAGYVPEEGIRSALKHGTLAMGQLGLAETLQILIGCDHTEPRGMEVAHKIEALFKKRCAEFKEEYKLNFGVYYTPKFIGRLKSDLKYKFSTKRAIVIRW